ncbi:MAG: YggU family protein [Gammaproteobacteria bacterium]|nr:MAG: YggU family protein [Gammaproteobacteria bacterium]RTZ75773.1 MAG: YggU family protein [Gammaproteobacteria bacterium]
MSQWYRRDGDDLILLLRIQPRAGRDGFGEILDGYRKLRIKAPPVDGKANDYLVRFLAKKLGVARSAVRIEQGQTGRNKRIRIRNLSRLPELD